MEASPSPARPQDSCAAILASGTGLHYFPGQIRGVRGPIKKTVGRRLNNSQLEVTFLLKSRHDLIRKGGEKDREREGKRKGNDKPHRSTLSPVEGADVNRVAVTLMN